MGVIQAISKGFKESKNLSKLILIFFGFNFIMGLVMLPFTPQDQTTAPSAVPLVISLISVFLFIFVQAGALGAIKKQLQTNSWEISDFVGAGKKFYTRILGLFGVIIVVAVIAILVVSLITALIFAIANNGFTRALVAAIVTILSVLAAIILLFPIYSVVVDDIGPVAAVKKCYKFSMENFKSVLGLLIVLFLVTFGIAFLIGLLAALLVGVLPLMIGQILSLLINSGLQGYLSVVMMAALMAYYLSKNAVISTPSESIQEEAPSGEEDLPAQDEQGPRSVE